MLEKCPKIGVRSYQRDRKSNISNIQKTLRNFVFGGFLILKNENSFKFETRIKKS